jgi:hypothetical protein
MRGHRNSSQKHHSSLQVLYADQILKTREGRYARRPKIQDQVIPFTETNRGSENPKRSEIYPGSITTREEGLYHKTIQVIIRRTEVTKIIKDPQCLINCKNYS